MPGGHAIFSDLAAMSARFSVLLVEDGDVEALFDAKVRADLTREATDLEGGQDEQSADSYQFDVSYRANGISTVCNRRCSH